MRRYAAAIGIALVLGCRPSAELETGAAVSVTPDEAPPRPHEETGDASPPPASTSAEPEPVPPPSTEEGTSCELLCADVHGCVLDQVSDVHVAAAIELGCLDACVRARPSFLACERPATISSSTCAPLLDCVRSAWPGDERPGTIVESPFASDGCLAGCSALADCYGRPEAAEQCAEKCREVLSPELQRMAGECAASDDCEVIEICMMSLPGA